MLLRAPEKTLALVKQMAAWHERTVTAEARAYMDVGITGSMVELLNDPDFLEELRAERPDFDVEAERRRVAREHEEAKRVAFSRRPNLGDFLGMSPN